MWLDLALWRVRHIIKVIKGYSKDLENKLNSPNETNILRAHQTSQPQGSHYALTVPSDTSPLHQIRPKLCPPSAPRSRSYGFHSNQARVFPTTGTTSPRLCPAVQEPARLVLLRANSRHVARGSFLLLCSLRVKGMV